jgi:hypothetical protein
MSDQFFRSLGVRSEFPTDSMNEADPCVASCDSTSLVGGVLRRRFIYAARFLYWTVRHRSTKHVRWVLAYEGYTW